MRQPKCKEPIARCVALKTPARVLTLGLARRFMTAVRAALLRRRPLQAIQRSCCARRAMSTIFGVLPRRSRPSWRPANDGRILTNFRHHEYVKCLRQVCASGEKLVQHRSTRDESSYSPAILAGNKRRSFQHRRQRSASDPGWVGYMKWAQKNAVPLQSATG